MSQPNHFSERKPCVVLLVQDGEEPQVLLNDAGEPRVFPKFTKARKFVANNIKPELHPFIHYANEKPELGAGDREETHNKRCLRCNSFLRLSGEQNVSQMHGNTIAMDILVCPKCDLGEE